MTKQLTPFKIALLYAVFAALWIVASGKLLAFTVNDASVQGQIEIAKGLLFVVITSSLLYLLLKNWRKTIIDAKIVQHNAQAITQALMNSAPNAMVSIDQFGKIIAWNPQAEIMFGYSAKQAIGCDVAKLTLPRAHRDAHRQNIAQLLKTDTKTIRNYSPHKNHS
jgi:PAS domain-containing protein